MPRPKKIKPKPTEPVKPTTSEDLGNWGDGILEGIHYDPFEPSVYCYGPGRQWSLESGPDLFVKGFGFICEAQSDQVLSIKLGLNVIYPPPTLVKTHERGQVKLSMEGTNGFSVDIALTPLREFGFRLVGTFVAGDKLTIKMSEVPQ